jgi:hypothetical protein
MKITIISFVLVLFAKLTFAQQDLLSFDEHNKYIYYQVADAPNIPVDTLHARGLNFVKSSYPKAKLKKTSGQNEISGEAKFPVYEGTGVFRHEAGEMSYQFTIEFKDQKYRYWLTGFIFTPFERDRYGNYVPKQGLDVPLENALSRYQKKDVDNYLNETGTFCKQFGDRLKSFIINAPKKEEITKKVVTDKW